MGSNPTADIFVCCLTYASFNFFVFCVVEVRAAIAQLGERQTEDLEVPGSIPGLGIFFLEGGMHSVYQYFSNIFRLQEFLDWPRGPMDKASVFGTEDCRFESYRGQFF